MTKICFGCGAVSDNNLYACSQCLGQINNIRREAKLNYFYRKTTLIGINKILLIGVIGYALMISLVVLGFSIMAKNPNVIKIIHFLIPTFLSFVAYFLVGVFVGRLSAKTTLKHFLNEKYYQQKPLERIKDPAIIKVILLFFVLYVVAGFILIFIQAIVETIYNIPLKEPLLHIKLVFIQLFVNGGFMAGLSTTIYLYSDWIKKLEK